MLDLIVSVPDYCLSFLLFSTLKRFRPGVNGCISVRNKNRNQAVYEMEHDLVQHSKDVT